MSARLVGAKGLQVGLSMLLVVIALSAGLTNARVSEARSCDPCPVVTTDDLNLRSGPSTYRSILWVIPKGTEVIAENAQTNGFSRVTVNGRNGWAFHDYLVGTDVPDVTGTLVTTDYLNLRRGPGTNEEVVQVMPPLASLESTDQIIDGFRYVYFNGMPGWAFDEFLASGTTLTTTSALNLRAKATTSAQILTVIPAGASVTLIGDESNGFVAVSYNGMKGWAYRAYLS
jgi:uncharacterized protein YraI